MISPKLIRICIPSKGRAELFQNKSYQLLKHCTFIPWTVFVEPQDRVAYKFVGPNHLVVLPRNNRGLGYSLDNIRRYCLKLDSKFCWKIDDDVKHFYTQPRVITKEEQAEAIRNVVVNVLKPALAVFRHRLGGISFPNKLFHMDWKPFTHINKMFETTYIVRVKEWLTPIYSKGHNEEAFISANFVLRNLISLRTGIMAWDADLSMAAGGLQSFDREAEQRECFSVMLEKHPELMELLERQEYLQNSGKNFLVVNKKTFNRRFSQKLPLKKPEKFPKEVIRCLSKLV